MARYVDVHPVDPQPRLIAGVVEVLRRGGVVAYPTDSSYALGCVVDAPDAVARLRAIRHLDDRHDLTLVCRDVAQAGPFVRMDNAAFRAVKASTPGGYTFILTATGEVPRRLQNPRKKTVGIRIPDHRVAQALVAALGEPLLSTTLLLPGDEEPMTDGWAIKERLDHLVDAVVDAGECGRVPTTVVDLSQGEAVVVRVGTGDPARFG